MRSNALLTRHNVNADFFASYANPRVRGGHAPNSRRTTIVLWVIQALLAALFLFAGGMKLVMPIAMLTKDMPLPGLFLRFIGVAEVSGALGLILPGLVHVREELTSLAAAGLVVIMIGATGVTLASGVTAMTLVPVIVGFLAAFVAYERLVPPVGYRLLAT